MSGLVVQMDKDKNVIWAKEFPTFIEAVQAADGMRDCAIYSVKDINRFLENRPELKQFIKVKQHDKVAEVLDGEENFFETEDLVLNPGLRRNKMVCKKKPGKKPKK